MAVIAALTPPDAHARLEGPQSPRMPQDVPEWVRLREHHQEFVRQREAALRRLDARIARIGTRTR